MRSFFEDKNPDKAFNFIVRLKYEINDEDDNKTFITFFPITDSLTDEKGTDDDYSETDSVPMGIRDFWDCIFRKRRKTILT